MNTDTAKSVAKRFVMLAPDKRKVYWERMQAEGISAANLPIPAVKALFDELRLSYAQQRQWFLWQLEPQGAAYNVPTALRLKGALDVEALRRSFEALVARHETLRTTFSHADGQALQVIHAAAPFALHVDAVQVPAGADRQALIRQWVETETRRPFDLESGPLLRVKLLKLGDDDHVLVLTLHHIVSDGWSMPVMVEELIRFYEGYRLGQPVQLPALPIQYADYAIWQRHWMEAGEQTRQLGYWTEQLGGDPAVLELPLDRPRPAIQSQAGASLAIELEPGLAGALKGLAREQGVTLFMLLLASFQALLHRYSGQPEIRVGVPIANRNRVETERLIGFFVNTQVLKAEFDLDTTFQALLHQVQRTALAAQAHQDLPFEQLVEALHPQRSLSHSPLFQVMYNHQTQGRNARHSLPGLTVEGLEWEQHSAQFDLTLETVETEQGIGASLNYATALFDASTIQRLASHWRQLLQDVVAQPQKRIAELALLDAQEQQQVQAWNRTEAGFDRERCVHELIAAQAQRTPDAPAVLFAGQTLSYRQLDQRANQLAHRLRERGVGPDVLVGLALERSLEMVVGLLGILKAGGAYVPLDPDYPQERLAYMIQDSGIGLLLTQPTVQLPASSAVERLMLEPGAAWLAGCELGAPQLHMQPDHLAYVIYTSGSTGKPKGVAVRHGGLANHMHWMQQAFAVQPEDRVLQKTAFSFDASVWEFWLALIGGAQLVVAEPGLVLDPQRFWQQVSEQRISILQLAPSLLHALLPDRGAGQMDSVRLLAMGGEALSAALSEQVRAGWGGQLVNLYGPTEATIDSTFHVLSAQLQAGTVPIGRAVANVRLHVLSDALGVTPFARGELYIGGDSLARGYLNQPALTAERFVPDPFDTSAQGGARLYRSGDMTRYRADGVIEYLGRADHQVKIRGLRIELGEIEASLHQHPAVREAVVLAVDGPHGRQLAAYLVASDGLAANPEQLASLREHLKVRLPEYMVPTHLLWLDALPLMPNGKLDRKALPEPDTSQLQQAYVAPQSELEQRIAAIWAGVLKLEKVGLTDNFFELGGDSIISIQVVSRARQAGIHFTPKALFQHQTVQGLASVARLGEQAQHIDQGPMQGQALLLPVHQYFFDEAIPEQHHWNQALLLRPGQALKAPVLDQALQALLTHHDALRLRYTRQADGAWAAEYGAPTAAGEALWTRTLDDADALQALCDTAQRSLDLERGELLRAVLATLPDGSQRLLLAIHHLVVDGVSWRILLEDLQSAYTQLAAGQVVNLPPKTSSTQAWAQRLQAHAADLQGELAYWSSELAGASAELPCDNPQGSLQNVHMARAQTRLDQATTRQLLQQAPAAYRTQVNDLLLTALARVVARWTGRDEVLIQLEGHGREELFDEIDLTRTVGWFTSMFPVRLSPVDSLDGSIKRIKEQLRAVPDKGIGFGALRYLGDAQAREALAALPVPRITFNYLGQFDASFADEQGEGGFFTPARESAGDSQSSEAPLGNWLSINGQVYGGELTLSWSFSHRMFAESSIQTLAQAYTAELQALIAHCIAHDTAGVTPSDFPLARLTQAQLDSLPVALGDVEDIYPLSPMQQGMLFHTLQAPETALYINQIAVSVDGLDSARFIAAWGSVLARHETLRTGFCAASQLAEPLQVVYRHAELPVRLLDWRDRQVAPSDLEALAAADAGEGFDLATAPLLRLTLVRLDAQRSHLLWTCHHILMDGWSSSRLFAEVFMAYHGRASDTGVGRYRDYIEWLGRQSQGQLEQFWRAHLAELEGPTLLADNVAPQPDLGLGGHAALYLRWDQARTEHLRTQAQHLRVTPNTLVQAAWLLLLQRYTGQRTVCFGATVAGRPATLAGADEMLGLFINTLPVVQTPQPHQRVSDWLSQLQGHNLELRDHEHAALADVQRWAGRPGQALFDSIVVFENYPVDERLQETSNNDLQFGQASTRDVTNYAMDLAVNLGQTLTVEFLYLQNRFTEAATAAILGNFERLLGAMLDNPQATLGSLDMLTPAQARLLQRRNELAALPVAAPGLLADDIAAHAGRRPDAIAVICADQQLSYAQLDEQANRLAQYLLAQGAGAETCIGIALERSVHTLVAFLAVMKSGAAYVPLDIDYPQERLAWIVEDSGMHLLLTHSSLSQRFAGVACTLELDRLDLHGQAGGCPQVVVQPDNLAYLIYTSGSTGKPKGVAVSHRQIRMHCRAIAERYEMSEKTRELLFMSFAFDGAQERWLSTLQAGGCLVVRDNHLWTAEQTLQVLGAQRIDIACFPPAYLQQLVECAERQHLPAPPVRVYCFGGDAVPQALFEDVKRVLRPQWLVNGYGPTETVVTPMLWKVPASGQCEAVYAPIGERVGQRTLYVLDEDLNLLPDGVAGELYIGGLGVARGYYRRAALTAERFVADPFAAGARLYRSGDRVRRRADGVIDYLGRLDNQVKIRGFRIEPGEVEARLRNQPGVREAVVIARDTQGSKQLLAYVVTTAQAAGVEQLREALRSELPDYMVPAHVMLLPALPLTPNGKLDRNALPAPQLASRPRSAPRNALERTLASIWQDVLEVDNVGIDDNFFELGGDSLRVLKMLSRVRACADLDIELKLRDVMAGPTIGELSGYSTLQEQNLDPLLLLNTPVEHGPALFCLHAGFGTVFDYEPLARRLEGRCSVYGLQCRMLLDPGWVDESLQSMAIDYAQYIRQKQPEGPYRLLGWSLGGALASLVTQELESQGQQVTFLGLVDSFIPTSSPAQPDTDWGEDLRSFLGVVLQAAKADLALPAVPAGAEVATLHALIDSVRAGLPSSAFAEVESAELAHTFAVAMHLKALSTRLNQLPLTAAGACCWWAGARAEGVRIDGSVEDLAIAAGHYDILRHPDWLASLGRRLTDDLTVAG
ncbi:non-ribosomal peptide synthetase [Pseudomonas palmensis]|uniref:non-ribosomal peptide synthetase n=1 Tax=Pseudomonas palmensis TaxID=2815362 RepID=UPI001AEA285B|nr:non-ribosomal peptide synthetase [Pseudomonas palmensis]